MVLGISVCFKGISWKFQPIQSFEWGRTVNRQENDRWLFLYSSLKLGDWQYLLLFFKHSSTQVMRRFFNNWLEIKLSAWWHSLKN